MNLDNLARDFSEAQDLFVATADRTFWLIRNADQLTPRSKATISRTIWQLHAAVRELKALLKANPGAA